MHAHAAGRSRICLSGSRASGGVGSTRVGLRRSVCTTRPQISGRLGSSPREAAAGAVVPLPEATKEAWTGL